MTCYSIDGLVPIVDRSAYVHPSAVLIGDVIVGPGCYVGPGASLRADFGRIVLGEGANVQDNCVVHGFPFADTVIEPGGHIGHGAVLHACVVRRGALVGIHAVVMDEAEICECSIVAACTFVPLGMKVPPRWLVAGVPARPLRELSEQQLQAKADGTAIYQELTRRCLATMAPVHALEQAEPQRGRLPVPPGWVRT